MPEVAFAICVQAFAGLRPGEVCNVRQECSPLGNGLSITSVNGTVKKVEIDLSAEYVLRSDGVRCGGIKKERRQRVYPAFLPAFCKAYEFHRKNMRGGFELEYCPMFVGSNGMAMTYADYRGRFQYLVTEYVRPTLLNHDDPECRLYGQLLCENKLGPPALRHWFSVQLTLMGEDIAGLQYWRGDSSPESALVYLQNKGDLINELSAANEMLADFMISEGGKLYGGR
jgi:integrase